MGDPIFDVVLTLLSLRAARDEVLSLAWKVATVTLAASRVGTSRDTIVCRG
jgi:hypothetical protein